MKATKFTVTITVECLAMDAVAGLVGDAINRIYCESISGRAEKDDGDIVEWRTIQVPVEF